MGRKRLLAILAGVVAAVGLQVAPAAAQELGPVSVSTESASVDLGAASLDASTDDGVSAGVKLEAGEATADPKVTVGDDEEPLKVEGGVQVGDDGADLGEATEPVTGPVNEALGGDDGDNGGDGNDGGDPDGTVSLPARDDRPADRNVQAAGPDADEAPAPDRAIALPRSLGYSGGGIDIQAGRSLAPGVPGAAGGFGSFDAPDVAPGISAPGPVAAPPQQAELATQPIGEGPAPRDIALRLLAALMVAGAGAVWHIARKELAPTS